MKNALEELCSGQAKALDLSYRQIGPEDLTALCTALRTNTTLVTLDVRGNALGDGGAAALVQALAQHPALQSVDLRENDVGVAGATAVARALRERRGIVRLDLLDRESLLREAARRTGAAISPEELVRDEPRMATVDLLLGYYRDHEADLAMPALVPRAELVERLAFRFLLRRALAALPEGYAPRVERPLIITGLFRTGTTLLHKLLAAPEGVRAPRLWEMWGCPVPPPEKETYETDPRIAEVERALRYQLIPETKIIHHLDARSPEECAIVLRNDFCLKDLLFSREIPSYAEWLEQQDYREFYRNHRAVLEYLGSRYPAESHWALKAPWHLWHLGELWGEYPDANVVFLHRDPVEAVGSSLSLLTLYPERRWRNYDPRAHAPRILRELAHGWISALAVRDRMEVEGKGNQIIDCEYRDLAADPLATARRIHDHFGYPLTTEGERRMRATLADNPKDKHGTHRYALAQWGLTPGDVDAAFELYYQRFGKPHRA